MADDHDGKLESLPFAGKPVSRGSSFRDRKKEKFKRHLANLGSPTNGGGSSSNEFKDNNTSVDSRDPTSPTSAKEIKTKPKPKPKKTSVVKARAPPAGFRSLQSRTPAATTTSDDKASGSPSTTTTATESSVTASPSEDSESYGGRFPKRQIRYVATSPSEESDTASYSLPGRPARSMITNPSEDSLDASSKKVSVPPKIPTFSHGVVVKTSHSSSDASEASAPTEVQANTTVKSSSSPLRRLLQRQYSNSQKSDVEMPFDEVRTTQSLDMAKAEARSMPKSAAAGKAQAQEKSKDKEAQPLRKSNSLSRLQALSKRSHSADKTTTAKKSNEKVEDTSSRPKPTHRPSPNLSSTRSRSLSRSRSAQITGAQRQEEKPALARGRSFSRGRKSKLVEMMASRKAAAMRAESKEPDKQSTTAVEPIALQISDITQTNSHLSRTERKGGSLAHSGSRTESEPEIYPDPTIEDLPIDDSREMSEKSHVVEDSTNATAASALSESTLKKHDADTQDEFEAYDDPPLEEMESEVSVGAFDMGSIHDYLPSDMRQRNAEKSEGKEAWASSNVVFEHDSDEKKEEVAPTFDTYPVEDAHASTVAEEKKEGEEEMETAAETSDASWDVTARPFAAASTAGRQMQSTADEVDVFDTSSWAAGTEARFSDVSLSRFAANVESEKQFVNLMMEEMKTRSLTEDESRMLSEAQRNIEHAEESVRIEASRIQEDVPLIPSNSRSEDDPETENGGPLEERLRAYDAPREVDEESVVESIAESASDSDDDSDVEYVGQEDMEDVDGDLDVDVLSRSFDQNDMVPAESVPAFDVDNLVSGDHERASLPPQSGYESIQMAMASQPPPPPPGKPKKKKGSKSKSGSSKSIPLIAPPPEEKIKQWEENKLRAQSYIASMNENLEKQDFRTLDSAFAPVVADNDARADLNADQVVTSTHDEGIPKTVLSPVATVNERASLPLDSREAEAPEINMFLSGLSDDDIHQDDQAVDQPEAVAKDTGELSADSDPKELADAEEAGNHLVDDTVNNAEAAEELDLDNVHRSQPSLFSATGTAPGETKLSKVFHSRAGGSKQTDTVLVDPRIADKVALASSAAAQSFEETYSPEKPAQKKILSEPADILQWFCKAVLNKEVANESIEDVSSSVDSLLRDRENFNSLCEYVADSVNHVTTLLRPEIGPSESILSSFDESTVVSAEQTLASADDHSDVLLTSKRPWMKPAILSESGSNNVSPIVLAANYVSFFYMASKLSKVPSPFGDSNPFLAMVVEASLAQHREDEHAKTPQELLFTQLDGRADLLVNFVYQVKLSSDTEAKEIQGNTSDDVVGTESLELIKDGTKSEDQVFPSRRSIFPDSHPSPFESSVWEAPRVVAVVLSFLGDPVAVCRIKMVNRFCCRVVTENEHILMQNAVRTGGIEMNVRPAFWMHVTMQKCDRSDGEGTYRGRDDLKSKAEEGENGKWHNVIERDVARSFGNMPPHKTGARLRNDSIVKALVTYGQTRVVKRGVKGGGEPFPTPEIGPKSSRKPISRPTSPFATPWEGKDGEEDDSVSSEVSETPTDRVSDWGGVSPKGSFTGSVNETDNEDGEVSEAAVDMSMEELALSGNSLTADAKVDLRNKLSFILHCLAVTHEDIGYCQGMDYVVAHLLRILQETVKWKTANNRLTDGISTAASINASNAGPITPENYQAIYKEIDDNLVVEEVVLRIMDTLFLHYNLRHMYWPELRCLKTCCRVFERLIQIKLPVLADHFEHHDLNVGLFALGWFQTLFLYLPSMPSATVCHMWDIWLVERSFKIFFRVGTAILFLSQPTLLNHELEGMMTYLNTIPDATLLRPDILIPCALNIKVTNKLLQELEAEVMKQP